MNRLSPVLYIRSTLASARPDHPATKRSGTAGNSTGAGGSTGETQASRERGTFDKPELPMPTGVSESESIALRVTGEDPPSPLQGRRESVSSLVSHNADGLFRSAESTGETPTSVEDDPFESVAAESISVGLVSVHMPRLTDPIAPCTGFAMQAEVVKHTSKFTEFRKAQRRALPERDNRAEESEGGLFFASRARGWSPPPLNAPNESRSSDSPPRPQPLFDYLRVDIPDVSIVVPGTEDRP